MYSTIVTVILLVFITLFFMSVFYGRGNLEAVEGKLQRAVQEYSRVDAHYKRLLVEHERTVRQCREAECSVTELKQRLRDACSDLREANKVLLERTALIGVKFTANVPHSGWTRTEFKLGIGPCGKEVTSIEFKEYPEYYVLTQRCTDGERKEFEYRKADISGRIERVYGKQ